MSIQRLPVFLSAAENLNFTKAAEEHCISQTAVSQQIKLLEQEVGFQLFIRGKRGVRLTPAGQVFYRQCKQLMSQYHTAVTQGQKISMGQETDLRIGYAGAYELWTIADRLRQYTSKFPEAEIHMVLDSNQNLINLLTAGQIDVAVVSGFGLELGSWLGIQTTLVDPCVLMISSDNPLSKQPIIDPNDLHGMPLVMNRAQDTESSISQIANMYASLGLADSKRFVVDDFYSLALLVSIGLAVSVMPESMIHWGIEGLSFRPLQGLRASAKTLLVYPKNTISSAVCSLLALR